MVQGTVGAGPNMGHRRSQVTFAPGATDGAESPPEQSELSVTRADDPKQPPRSSNAETDGTFPVAGSSSSVAADTSSTSTTTPGSSTNIGDWSTHSGGERRVSLTSAAQQNALVSPSTMGKIAAMGSSTRSQVAGGGGSGSGTGSSSSNSAARDSPQSQGLLELLNNGSQYAASAQAFLESTSGPLTGQQPPQHGRLSLMDKRDFSCTHISGLLNTSATGRAKGTLGAEELVAIAGASVSHLDTLWGSSTTTVSDSVTDAPSRAAHAVLAAVGSRHSSGYTSNSEPLFHLEGTEHLLQHSTSVRDAPGASQGPALASQWLNSEVSPGSTSHNSITAASRSSAPDPRLLFFLQSQSLNTSVSSYVSRTSANASPMTPGSSAVRRQRNLAADTPMSFAPGNDDIDWLSKEAFSETILFTDELGGGGGAGATDTSVRSPTITLSPGMSRLAGIAQTPPPPISRQSRSPRTGNSPDSAQGRRSPVVAGAAVELDPLAAPSTPAGMPCCTENDPAYRGALFFAMSAIDFSRASA